MVDTSTTEIKRSQIGERILGFSSDPVIKQRAFQVEQTGSVTRCNAAGTVAGAPLASIPT